MITITKGAQSAITKGAQGAITKGAQGTPTSASSTEPTHPNNHSHLTQRQGASPRRRRLSALVLAVLLSATGLFHNARPVAAIGASGTVGVGVNFSCVVVNNGVKCWGYNGSGQLGDGTTTDRTTPVDVIGLTSGVATISVGYAHACAVTTSGAAKCWGFNSAGQLGNGTNTTSSTPVNVSGLTSGVVAISAGNNMTCAVTSSGGAKCWGLNGFGQLGDGTTTSRTTPVDVSGLTSGVVAISAENIVTCALTSTGGVKCWGVNGFGQLGDGTTTNRTTPVDVIGLTSGVVSISVGNQQACALTSGGVVKCWGLNGFGAIGDGTTTNRTTPVSVPITGNVVSVHMSAHTTCAVMDDGTAQCWGDDSLGRAGIGYLVNGYLTLPRDVVGGGFISIDSGGSHSCAATTSGVRCTGSDVYGNTGIPDTLEANTYVQAFVGVSGLGSSGVGIAPTPGTTDLAVTKTASVSSATPGTPFDYTITVTNNGTVTATNVKATDKLPAGVTFNSATILTGSGSCSNNAGTVTCTWGSVAVGASVSAKITVTP